MALFDSDFLQRLEYLSLVSRRAFRGQLLAQRRSRQRGTGIEFADHREYTYGDDLRYVDWFAYARLGDVLLKRFQEEEDLRVHVLLDCSRSMAHPDPAKFDRARQLAAALAYIALADMDRVSVTAFSREICDTFPLSRGKGRVLTLLRFLERQSPAAGHTDLDTFVRQWAPLQRQGGLVLLVSDFFDPAGFQAGLDRIRHSQFDLQLVQLFSPSEARPDLLGDVELVDAETQQAQPITIDRDLLSAYQEQFASFLASVRQYARHYGLGYVQTSSEIPYDEVVLRMMRAAGTLQ